MKAAIIFFLSFVFVVPAFAQAAKTNQADKADYAAFKRQIMELPEYLQEKKNAPKLSKQNGAPVKITIAIEKDSTDEEESAANNILTGYIKEDMGATSENVFEIQFDRTTKKIFSVKNAGEGLDSGDEDSDSNPAHKKEKKQDDDSE